ncbi:MAG TPA: tetratricopeptide repeat protein [Candidatus Saccharimonadales bacterium]|nr:tetratricopeptide repeat protein [Candidatus Saccharimonadales bacterium]
MQKIVMILLGFVALALFVGHGVLSTLQQDKQCTTTHQASTTPPAALVTAVDYFDQGNYDYDVGDCKKAVLDYTQAIKLKFNYPEAFNNRAYTYMRMQDYAKALPDLDQAIKLRPNYVTALMNRGDIYNFYYNVDRQKALADYNTVLGLGEASYHGTSLCGHRLLAINNGWNVNTFSKLFSGGLNVGCE